MKPHLPTVLRRALLSALALAACAPHAQAAEVELTADEVYTYGEAAWADGTAYRSGGTYSVTSVAPVGNDTFSLTFEGGEVGVFTGMTGFVAEYNKDICFEGEAMMNEEWEVQNNGGAIRAVGAADAPASVVLKRNQAVSFTDYCYKVSEGVGDGGAISAENGDIELSYNAAVVFSADTAGNDGGAIAADEGNITLSHNTRVSFTDNRAGGDGGALYTKAETNGEKGHISLTYNKEVVFSGNSADTFGGAVYIDAGTMLMKHNDSVVFNANSTADAGGAICGVSGEIVLQYNGSLSFVDNVAMGDGGAIGVDLAAVNVHINKSVNFTGNLVLGNGAAIYADSGAIKMSLNDNLSFAKNVAGLSGGAIYAEFGAVELNENGIISFAENSAEKYGGAIYAGDSAVSLNDNDGVHFIGNTSGDRGGAIYRYGDYDTDDACLEIKGNDSVSFISNKAADGEGGAICSWLQDVDLSDNGNVFFIDNSAGDSGGAVFCLMGVVNVDNNDSVIFSGNTSADSGGAVFAYSDFSVAGNKTVVFEKNVEYADRTPRLRSLHISDSDSVLTLSAQPAGSITFKDSIYAAGKVELNRAGQTGTITFSAASAEADLRAFCAKRNIAWSAADVAGSRTLEIGGTTTLYGGTLELLDGVVVAGVTELNGEGEPLRYLNGELILAAGSAATLSMRDATVKKATSLAAGTTMKLEGVNTITKLTADGEVSMSFTLSQRTPKTAVLTMTENTEALLLNPEMVSVTGVSYGTHKLLDTKAASGGWTTKALSNGKLYWDKGILYYQGPTIESVLNKVPSSHNGRAGAALLPAAYAAPYAAHGALAEIFERLDNGQLSDKGLAAVAGASTAVLGQALRGDVERQLRAIRNRSAADSADLTVEADDCKYFAWVNAEGNHGEQDADGAAAGYTLESWGGTLGVGMLVNDQLTLGLALTAMYGDLKSDGPDHLKGDMDTAYISAFARYESGMWSHSFIGTVGTMDTDYTRTVSNAGYYTGRADTEGSAIGLMYELSRTFAISDKSSVCPVVNIAYRHTKVDAYRERGSEAALAVGDQSADTVTLGAGARYRAVVGEQSLNLPCHFEALALVKCDLGDTQSDANVGFINQATRAKIESAEQGAFGLELGAGIAVPVGSGSIFLNGTVELRSDYTDCNATIGYGLQF